MADVEVIKDFIKPHTLKKLQNTLLGNYFPWYYNDFVGKLEDTKGYFFNHLLFRDNKIEGSFFNQIALPLIGQLKFNNLIQIRINCYTREAKPFKGMWHVDNTLEHKVALWSLNTCNGYTEIKDKGIFKSIENQLIIFDGNLKHRSCSQTDTKTRINININYN